jgi:hypothetical protein
MKPITLSPRIEEEIFRVRLAIFTRKVKKACKDEEFDVLCDELEQIKKERLWT